jgi:hypothetical protein
MNLNLNLNLNRCMDRRLTAFLRAIGSVLLICSAELLLMALIVSLVTYLNVDLFKRLPVFRYCRVHLQKYPRRLFMNNYIFSFIIYLT